MIQNNSQEKKRTFENSCLYNPKKLRNSREKQRNLERKVMRCRYEARENQVGRFDGDLWVVEGGVWR